MGVEADDLEATGLQCVHDLDLVAARGLQADASDLMFSQPGGYFVETIDLAALAMQRCRLVRPKRDVQPCLADIDTGRGYKLCHVLLPYLQCDLGDLATVRVVKIGEEAPCSVADSLGPRFTRALPRVDAAPTTPAQPLSGTKSEYKFHRGASWLVPGFDPNSLLSACPLKGMIDVPATISYFV